MFLTAYVAEYACHAELKTYLLTYLHGQERDLATEPSLWSAQLYGTVYQQQFVKLTACIRLGASSKHICLLIMF